MGYVRRRSVFLLEFADEKFKGLEIRVGAPNIGTLRPLMAAGAGMSVDDFDEMLALFIDALISWNVEDELADGTLVPVPADRAGVMSCEPGFLEPVLKAWADAMVGVPAPLDSGSTSGFDSLERSLPMEPVSSSLAS